MRGRIFVCLENYCMRPVSLEQLYQKIKRACPKQELVFGDGKPGAEIMLIGEAPGKDEVAQKKPFVGRAGKNLAEFLGASGLKRDDLYVTNGCKFRPTKISAKNTVSNRPPTKEEILAARPFLHEEIRLVSPRLLVTLGNTPRHAVWDFSVNIGGCHGAAEKIMLEKNGYWLFPLYHPASIIYNPALKETYMCDISNLTVWVNKNL